MNSKLEQNHELSDISEKQRFRDKTDDHRVLFTIREAQLKHLRYSCRQ